MVDTGLKIMVTAYAVVGSAVIMYALYKILDKKKDD
jgi:hypothetical protein